MKKNISVVLILFFISIIVCSCSVTTVYQGEEASFRPAGQMEYLTALLSEKTSKVHTLDPFNGYYILQDVFSFEGRALTGMTVPVFRTKGTDSRGNFILTLARFKVKENNLSIVPDSEVQVKINAKKYGLSPNTNGICRFIDVDLSSYGIVIGENETIGFSAPNDTICLFAINPTEVSILAKVGEEAPNTSGYLKKSGSGFSTETIPVDFRWQFSELDAAEIEEDAYYEELAAKLRETFAGKKVSLIGDSISTLGGVTNVSMYNSTMVKNAVYYNKTEKMPSVKCTYWGRLAADLDMELCAINAWSGSLVYGNDKYSYEDAAVLRPAFLYNENGTPNDSSDDIDPDLILVYIGLNDFNRFGLTKCTAVNDILKEAGDDKEKLKTLLDQWFEQVLEKSEGGEALVHDVNYSQFDEAYALMLYRLLKYNPDARVLVMGLMGNGRTSYNDGKMQWYNKTMKTLCEYFSIQFLDWGSIVPIDRSTAKYYYMDVDVNVLHPNISGHKEMERAIMEALAE